MLLFSLKMRVNWWSYHVSTPYKLPSNPSFSWFYFTTPSNFPHRYSVLSGRYFNESLMCIKLGTSSKDWTCNFRNTLEQRGNQYSCNASHKFYIFAIISTQIDVNFQCQSNGSIFIWNGWELTKLFYEYSRWFKIHQNSLHLEKIRAAP